MVFQHCFLFDLTDNSLAPIIPIIVMPAIADPQRHNRHNHTTEKCQPDDVIRKTEQLEPLALLRHDIDYQKADKTD